MKETNQTLNIKKSLFQNRNNVLQNQCHLVTVHSFPHKMTPNSPNIDKPFAFCDVLNTSGVPPKNRSEVRVLGPFLMGACL